MWRRFSENSRKAIFYAQEEAGALGQSFVAPEHLLLGLVCERESAAGRLLGSCGVDPEVLKADVLRRASRDDASGRDLQLTPRAKRVVELAAEAASELEEESVETGHILLAILREQESMAAKALADHGVTSAALITRLREMRENGVWEPQEALKPSSETAAAGRDPGDFAANDLVTLAFLHQALDLGADRVRWTFGADLGVAINRGETSQTLATLPANLIPSIRRYFENWARFSGAASLGANRPIRLAFSHLGRDYDLALTMEAGDGVTLAVKLV